MANNTNVAEATLNIAALKVAAVKDMASFMEFAKSFNTYDIRNSKGVASDKACRAAIGALQKLEESTGEKILLVSVETLREKEFVLDQLFYALKSGDLK